MNFVFTAVFVGLLRGVCVFAAGPVHLQGYLATLASFGPFSALYFMFYEQAKAASQSLLGERNQPKILY